MTELMFVFAAFLLLCALHTLNQFADYTTMNKKRADEEYEIEALSKGLLVLEALEGISFEPVSVAKIMERTGLKRDVVDRTLKTLRLRGYTVQSEDGEWTIARRFIRFAEAVNRRYSVL